MDEHAEHQHGEAQAAADLPVAAFDGGGLFVLTVVQLLLLQFALLYTPVVRTGGTRCLFNVSLLCQNDNLDQYWAPRGPGTTFTI